MKFPGCSCSHRLFKSRSIIDIGSVRGCNLGKLYITFTNLVKSSLLRPSFYFYGVFVRQAPDGRKPYLPPDGRKRCLLYTQL